MKFDHVALNVKDIARSVAWYKNLAHVLYEESTWQPARLEDSPPSTDRAHCSTSAPPASDFLEAVAREAGRHCDPDGKRKIFSAQRGRKMRCFASTATVYSSVETSSVFSRPKTWLLTRTLSFHYADSSRSS